MNHTLQKGKLKRWNDDRGFGFICPDDGKRDMFIHISALKRMRRRPVVGDVIYYQVHNGNDGKQKAVNAKIEGVAEVKLSSNRNYIKPQKENSWISKALPLALVVAIGSVAYIKLIKNSDNDEKSAMSLSSYAIGDQTTQHYSCVGKVYCSEMTSCDEATFYQRNCPGTKMDGDGDGIPCESQWCSW